MAVKCIQKTSKSKRKNVRCTGCIFYKKTKVFGTYKYQGVWNSLDHIFLSDAVLQKVKNCFIYDAAWLLEEDAQGGYKPFRTYLGPKYHEGVSDHLPIVLQLRL